MRTSALLRMGLQADPRALWNFLFNCGWKGMRAVQRFEQRRRRGEPLSPAFIFISINDDCNLRCQGCWIGTEGGGSRRLEAHQLAQILERGRRQGVHFYGILGGEPLLHPDLLSLFEQNRDCYFQLFTNGTLLTDEIAARLRRAGNVTPLISIEGIEQTSDVRRGGRDVYRRGMRALDVCRRHRLIFGVASSVCQSNIDDLVSERFLADVASRGAFYVWYFIYRPVGPRPCPELALDAGQILRLRKFLVGVRSRAPLAVVDAYWDHEGRALCPAATGISHHIGPGGDLEPCPPIQFARENFQAANGHDPFASSAFLEDFRKFSREAGRGCILLEDPQALRDFLVARQAADTSGRGTGLEELARMRPLPGHHQPGMEIPEQSLPYALAKKFWFFGFGAYG